MRLVTFTAIICLYLAGCATATRGTMEAVKINSEPSGATAITDIPSQSSKSVNGYLGCSPTPCGISMPRRSAPVITISKPGYQPIKFKVTSAVATSSTSVPTGALVAGLPPGSHVIAGSPELLKRIPSGSSVILGGIATMGVGAAMDIALGANKNLSPNPVMVILAPDKTKANQE